ncbi:MAG: family 43 glycosylhydrolase [Lachnospiraceae bacterium]|nr:family 43 glycosylhydrolase [Lachnospiraceae bacterium]
MTLQEAVLQENLEMVRRILIENPACIDEKPDGVWIPYQAAKTGNLEIVKYIVEYSRASFNETDENCRTMLHYAVESGNLELVKYLTERVGLSPLAGDKDLVTPYELAERLCKLYERFEYANETEDEDKAAQREIVTYFESYCGFSLDDSYKNPILTGMHPDPSIVCVGDDFYMVNSSFVFFPCIPISHSRDLIHWEIIGHAITNPAWSGLGTLEGGRGYWAPDISYYKGRFYITATYRLNDTVEDVDSLPWNGTPYRKQMVVSSERPEGPYSEPVFIDEDGIDPSIFTDDDGRRYMLLNRGARIFEISPDGTKQLSEAKLLYYGHNKRAPEGSHLLKKDGWYYLFQAEGGTGPGHRISVSRSRELFGIYEPCPFNPIMRQNDPKQAIQRCGHGKPVQTPNGEWYMVYLCGRQLEGKYSMLGRETALDKITWTADGWPMVNHLQGPSVLAKKPELPEFTAGKQPTVFGRIFYESDSTTTGLGLQWVTPREPEDNFAELKEDGLYLLGSRTDLCEVSARNLLLQRQTAFDFTAETKFSYQNLQDGQDAGMTCYYDENTYLKFGVFRECGKTFLKVQEHVDNDTWDSFCVELEGECTVNGQCGESSGETEIVLRCETRGLERTFSYRMEPQGSYGEASSVSAEPYQLLGILPNVYYLCDEGIKRGKRFTGAMLGMYVYGEGVRIPFRYFQVWE